METFSDLHSVCIQVFDSVASTVSMFVLPLFLGRVVFANILGEGFKVFGAIKGVAIYFILISGFPILLDILFSIPDAFLPGFNGVERSAAESTVWGLGTIPGVVDRVLEVLLSGLYWVAYYLHVFFMLLMCSMAPIVFLVSVMMGVGLGLEVFIGLLVVGSSWPVIWFGFDQVHSSLVSVQGDEFGAKCLELLVTFLKGIGPVAFAGIAIKSPAGRAISGTAKAAVSSGQWAGAQAVRMRPVAGVQTRSTSTNIFSRKVSDSQSSGSGAPSTRSTRHGDGYEQSRSRLKKAAKEFKKKENRGSRENPRSRNSKT